jgi:TPR repeat protein
MSYALLHVLFPFFDQFFTEESPPTTFLAFFLFLNIQMKVNLNEPVGDKECQLMRQLHLHSLLWKSFHANGSLSLLLLRKMFLQHQNSAYFESYSLRRMNSGQKKRLITSLIKNCNFLYSRNRIRQALPIYRDLAILGYSRAFAHLALNYFIMTNIPFAMQLVSVGRQYNDCNECDGVLAYCLLKTKLKTKGDEEEAFRLALKSAHSEYVYGFLALALYFLKVEKDYERARLLLLQAAKKNDSTSWYYLGKIYEKGLGVAKDHYEAHRFYNLASEKNHPKAMRKVREQLRRQRAAHYGDGGSSD